MSTSRSDEVVVVDHRELERLAAEILVAVGVSSALALQWSEALVWADLRGVESHGVLRLPRYVDAIRGGEINADPQWTTRTAGAVVVIDADRAVAGPPALLRGLDRAIATAERLHIGWCSVRNMGHGGAIGFVAELGARRDMAVIVIGASIPTMAYHGAAVPALGTNPLAIAFPTASDPLVLDMSTAAAAFGKILFARDAGLPVPAGWGLDSEGEETTDPHAITTLLPVGGAKGSGLSLMIECLASVMVGNALSRHCSRSPNMPWCPSSTRQWSRSTSERSETRDVIREDAERLRRTVLDLRAADVAHEVLLPGDRGRRLLTERRSTGIPIVIGTWNKLMSLADELCVKAAPT